MENSEKLFKVGMYGGKFLPMHKGHLLCLKKAAEECETVYLILFYGGDQEMKVRQEMHGEYLSLISRWAQVERAAKMFSNVTPKLVDVSCCHYPDGSEDWDAETPLVEAACGHLDAVYSSEISYIPYFERAYPDAVIRTLDPERREIHISATDLRSMDDESREKWLI